jgi:hypothetical protein
VNRLTDSKNCGMCDRDCFSGSCDNGTCQPWVVLPKSELNGPPPAFATDGKDLVWFKDDGGKIGKIATTGSPLTTTMVVYGDLPGRLALSKGIIVWTSIERATSLVNLWTLEISNPVSGTAVPLKTLGTANHTYKPVGLAVDATADRAYFELVEDGVRATIQECSLTGNVVCASIGDVTPSAGGDDVVLGQGYVFWTEASKGRVVRYSLLEGTTTDAAVAQASPYVLATDSASVYWAERSGGNFSIKRTSQENPDLSAPEPILSGIPGTLTSLVTDGAYVYYAGMFGRNDKVGYVLATPGQSGQPFFQDLGATEVPAGLLALAGGAVYYYAPEAVNIQGRATVR